MASSRTDAMMHADVEEQSEPEGQRLSKKEQ